MIFDMEGEINASMSCPHLVLCARSPDLVAQWFEIAKSRPDIDVYQGSILDVAADAIVSPANSFGLMRAGVDAIYSAAFLGIEERVRSKILALHGGELPIGEATIVETGVAQPRWLISTPTVRTPTEVLPHDTVNPFLATRAVLRLWQTGVFDDGTPIREIVYTIALPGLGTGMGGLSARTCAIQVAAAWDEVFSIEPAEPS